MPDAPRTRIDTPRLRLRASAPELADAALDYEQRNREHFARWSPPPAQGLFTLAFHQKAMADDVESFVAGREWRWWLQLNQPSEATRLIGIVRFSQVSRGPFCSAVLGYSIDTEHEGAGLMREALAAAIAEVFSPAVNLHRIQANVRPENARSLQLLDALGFVREGLAREYLFIDGAWRDHVMTARTNADYVKPDGW
jgi:ribosomal-protein-alanine N-acetyltransferase